MSTTLTHQIGVDEEARPPNETSVKPLEAYGKYPNQQMRGIFKEWKEGGPKADIADHHIEFIINFEFADTVRPTKKGLIDAVLREPKQRQVQRDRYDPRTGQKLEGSEHKWRFDPDTGTNYSDKGLHFEQGQFVEFLGTDMRWHLSTVRRVVKLAVSDDEGLDDENVEYEYFYNIGSESMIVPREVRAPEEGLKLVYGFRPWVWQQWAALQLEQAVRFCQDHDRDFKAMSFRKHAKDLWDYWYNNPKNAEFKNHVESVEEEYPGSRDKLVTHILTPFGLMDAISKKPEYSLEGDVNIYMYVSFLGSGFLTAFACFAIQLTVPILLVEAAISGNPRFAGSELSWDQFCTSTRNQGGLIMNIVVLMLYGIRVLPDLLFELFNSTGNSNSAKDKVNAMRAIIWEQGDDTVSMQVGYKVNKYANGLYVSILMTIMLFVLFLTADIFEIILNALALEFVHSLDEELASGEWFDPGARWITAGAVEQAFLLVLNLEDLLDWRKFCHSFDIDPEVFTKAFDGKPRPMRGYRQGRKDSHDVRYMSQKDRYYTTAAKMARRMRNKLAVWNFQEETVTFGFVDLILKSLGVIDTGVFSRFRSFSTWSRWNRVLYLAPVPTKNGGQWYSECSKLLSNHVDPVTVDETMTRDTSMSGTAVKSAANLLAGIKRKAQTMSGDKAEGLTFLNLDDKTELTPIMRFKEQLLGVLLFEDVAKSIGTAMSRKAYYAIVFRLVDGIIDWFAYFYQLMFPLVLVFFLILIILCY